MLFSSPTDKPIFVATTDGRTATVPAKGEWTTLPESMHRRAFELGCVVDGMSEGAINPFYKAAPERVTEEGPNARILEVLREIKASCQPGDLTFSGKPNLTRLAKRAGFGVNRDDVMRMWADLNKTPDRKDGISRRKVAGIPNEVAA